MCLQVQEVASFQGKPLKELFSIFKQPICKFVVDAIDEIQSREPAAKVSLDTVLEVASVFEFKDVHSFLKVTELKKCLGVLELPLRLPLPLWTSSSEMS